MKRALVWVLDRLEIVWIIPIGLLALFLMSFLPDEEADL